MTATVRKLLTAGQWAAIRAIWEGVPDVSYAGAARRAAEKMGFEPPGRTTIESCAKRQGWKRQYSKKELAETAMHRADVLTGAGVDAPDASTTKKADTDATLGALAAAAFDETADARAAVLSRHRKEWEVIPKLRDEALALREVDPGEAFNKAKLTKITAEALAIQQTGETAAWGLSLLDSLEPPDFSKMSDEQLERIAKGRL